MIGARSPFVERRPEPGALWVRYHSRRWPGDGEPWSDVAAGSVAFGSPGDGIDWDSLPDDDVLYLPPLCPEHDERVRHWAEAAATPPLVQRRPGRPALGSGQELWDPLVPMLRQQEDWLEGVPRGAGLLWPLLPGRPTDPAEVLPVGRLEERQIASLHFLPVRLAPETIRRLVDELDLPEASWSALFHGRLPDPRPWLQVAAAAGLAVVWPRSLPRREGAGARWRDNRELAEALTWAGELGSRLALAEGTVQSYYRAARHVDECSWSLADLEREGNLSVLPWLEGPALELVRARLHGGRDPLVELWRRYLAGEDAGDAS